MDKNKIIEAAAKLVAKGAYDKAIKEYQKVLEADPKDVRILQKMGELFQKKNDNVQAAQYFTRVGESYTNDGFFLKAVALYKQVLKLDPSLMDINLKLAELHQQLQLMGEAMTYFQLVANHYDKQGDTRRSLDVLRKMVDLDPDNAPSRLKLADLYAREGLNTEAAGEYQKVADNHKRNNRTEEYLRVAERLSAMQPENLQLAKELAEAYLQKNDQKRALAKLQICFKADNRDIDTLRLLAVAFQGLGQMSKTISVYKELARAHEDKQQLDESNRIWKQVEQLDPQDPDVLARKGPPPPTASNSSVFEQPTRAGQPSGRAPPPQPPPPAFAHTPGPAPVTYQPPVAAKPVVPKSDNLGKLLTETDVYVKYGLHDKALEHLRKVFAIEPENIDAHEKAYAIYVASNNHAQSFEQLLNVLRLHTRSGDAARAQPYLTTILQQNPAHPEVPVFVAALKLQDPGSSAADSGPQEAEDAILVDSNEDEVIVADEPDEVISAEMAVTEDEPIEPADVVSHDDVMMTAPDMEAAARMDADPPPVGDPFASSGEQQVISDFEAEPPTAFDDAVYEVPEDPTTGQVAMPDDLFAPPPPPLSAPRPRPSAIPMTTVPNAEPAFLGDEPRDVPTRSMAKVGAATVPSRPAVATARPAPAPEPIPEPEPIAEFPPYEPEPEPAATYAEEAVEAPPEEEPAAEECDEATFFVEQGLYEEAREILETILIAYPDHRRAAELMARVEAEEGGAAAASGDPAATANSEEGRDAFDLAAELANELGDFGEEQSTSGENAAPASGDDYQVSVEEVFAEFKKGLEKVVKPEDVDTHYDLGVAYKEMGLIDDAVTEFTVARKGCAGKRKEIDCLSMIGMLQLSRGDFAAAIDAYRQGLASEHAKGDVEKSLRYELAGAHEASGQPGKALGQYMKVQGLDPKYREVSAHVDRLSALATPEEDDPPPPAAAPKPSGGRGGAPRKVGYV